MKKHSVILDKSKCNGCSNCMRRCPTDAIRIRDRKAVIIEHKCIDCGECIRVCPYHAKNAVTDSIEEISRYRYKVALPSAVLYGQFPFGTDINNILNAFLEIGFNYVYEAAKAAELVNFATRRIIQDGKYTKPLMSSYCPAIVRLVQMRYPTFLDNIIQLETPMEIASRIVKDELSLITGFSKEEIGVFYITPCPARVTSIKNPLGISIPLTDGAISIDEIYPKLVRAMSKEKGGIDLHKASNVGIGFVRAGGQCYSLGIDNYLAVDGIENVMKVLDELERGKLPGIDFFEGLACTGGCVGGPLTIENSFIAKTRIRNITKVCNKEPSFSEEDAMILFDKGYFSWTESIEPVRDLPLDTDFEKAMQKLEMIDKINKSLPEIDCGSCGAPSCRALAEDIVRGEASIDECIFIKEVKHEDK